MKININISLICSALIKVITYIDCKGKSSPALAVAKGGENLDSGKYRDVPRVFQAYCKKVLQNEARDAHRAVKARRKKEVSFSDLSSKEANQLYTIDEYFASGDIDDVVAVNGRLIPTDLLKKALMILSEDKRETLRLYYYEELTDAEIGHKLNLPRSTVQYKRTSCFADLRAFLEKHLNANDE